MTKLDPEFFDRSTTLVNLSNSILNRFGVAPFHPTIPEVDELLKTHKKIALFLFDGSGEWVLKRWPRQSRFIREHAFLRLHSVNPATTVACTTSLLTGKYPIETGWLGWSLQFDALGFPVDVFPNRNSLTKEKLEGTPIMDTTCPVTRINELINAAGHKARLCYQYPLFDGTGPKKIEDIVSIAGDFFQKENGEFLYMYWTNPDETIHEYGVDSRQTRHQIKIINATVRDFVKKNPDVLLLTIADHGLINVQYRDLKAFPDAESCLRKPLSIEGRTPTFFVKPGMESAFEEAFRQHFPDFFLMSREEVLNGGYFGEGTPNPHALEFIGDYVAVSLKGDVLTDTTFYQNVTVHLGNHAGGTREERDILLAAYNR